MFDEPISLAVLQKNIDNMSSACICEMINAIRQFGMGNDMLTLCMNELVERRKKGESYPYEKMIVAPTPMKMPKLDMVGRYRSVKKSIV